MSAHSGTRSYVVNVLTIASMMLGLSLAAPPGVAAVERLVVYTAIAPDLLERYREAFEREVPEVKLDLLRAPSGVTTARLLAERERPVADVVWGVAASSLLLLAGEGLLEPYAPKGVEQLSPRFVDRNRPPAWVGMEAWAATVCFNTSEGAAAGLSAPVSWQDIADPAYRGQVTMPDPASSGTGYLIVSSWLQLMGEQAGWAFMDRVHDNIAFYTHSGSKPCRLAGTGEFAIGISYEYRAAQLAAEGAPIALVFPREGIGWDIDAAAIVRGTPRLAAARKLMDWTVSRGANELYAESWALVAMRGVAKQLPLLPPDLESRLLDIDLEWAARERDRILDEWRRRYGVKTEPKE